MFERFLSKTMTHAEFQTLNFLYCQVVPLRSYLKKQNHKHLTFWKLDSIIRIHFTLWYINSYINAKKHDENLLRLESSVSLGKNRH